MKIFLIILAIILLSGLIYFAYLGYKSQSGSAPGLIDSRLSHCPDSPNCFCTEYSDDKSHFTDAVDFSALTTNNISQLIKDSIKKSGGVIVKFEDNYISATYTSNLFRYVDDFEVRIDTNNQLIQLRSASRVGRSDFGANLKRIELFKNLINKHK